MRTKILVAITVLVLASGMAAANAPLKNFEYSIEEGAETELVGGQEGFVQANFSNVANQPMPLVVNFTLSSDEVEVTGEELSVKAVEVNSTSSLPGGDGANDVTELTEECDTYPGTENSAWYTCTVSGEDELLPKSRNIVDFRTESVPYIQPAEYSFNFEVISTVGVASGKQTEDISEGSEVVEAQGESTSASVNITVGEDATADVSVYDNLSTDAPEENQDLVGAVDVEVQDSSGNDVDSSGEVTLSYSQDTISRRGLNEENMDVYYYEEESGTWTSEDITVTDHDLVDNTITADVPHFSVYAAYAEEEQDTSDDSGGSNTITIDDEDEEPQEEENDTVQNETEGQPPEPPTTGEDETGEQEGSEKEDGQTGEETGQETEEPETPGQGQQNGLTAAFAESPTGQAAAFIAVLLVAAGAVYRYRGEEVKSKAGELRQKAEELR